MAVEQGKQLRPINLTIDRPDGITHSHVAVVAAKLLEFPEDPRLHKPGAFRGLPGEEGSTLVFSRIGKVQLSPEPSIRVVDATVGAQSISTVYVDRFWGSQIDFEKDIRESLAYGVVRSV